MCQLHGREPIIDLLDGDVSDRVHLLARLRVSDPGSLLAPYDELSTSEQFSVALAVWFSRGEPVLILDDFARSFDAVTRRALARILGRECRSRGVRLAVSTSEAEEIVDDLAPDCIVTLSDPGDMRIELPAITNLPEFGFAVEPGTIDDFKKLSHLHYHGSLDLDPNSTDTWIFKASYDGELAGVRVFAAPYPRQWERLDYLFGHINQRMCIAHRIVVHPLYRGLGVGRLLSAKSLFPRQTVLSRSALSNISPFYDSCGYTSFDLGIGDITSGSAGLSQSELVEHVVDLYQDDLDCYLRAISGRPLAGSDRLRLQPILRDVVTQLPPALLSEVCDVAHMAGRIMRRE